MACGCLFHISILYCRTLTAYMYESLHLINLCQQNNCSLVTTIYTIETFLSKTLKAHEQKCSERLDPIPNKYETPDFGSFGTVC